MFALCLPFSNGGGQREGTVSGDSDELTEHFGRQILSLLAKCCLWPAFFVAYYLLAGNGKEVCCSYLMVEG